MKISCQLKLEEMMQPNRGMSKSKHLILSIKKTLFTESILSILLNLENEFGVKSFLIYMKFRKKPLEVEDRKRSRHYHNLELSESKSKPIQ